MAREDAERAPPRLLQPGDPAPWFHARSSGNPNYCFDTVAGRHVVLCFLGSAGLDKSATVLRRITGALRARFDDESLVFFGVSIDHRDETLPGIGDMLPGIRFFWDFDLRVSKLFGAVDANATNIGHGVVFHQMTLVLDPMLRVIANIPINDADRHNRALEDVLRALPPAASYAGAATPAPVLVLPRVFEPELCRALIALYEANGGTESGFMRQQDDHVVGVVDPRTKRRKDFNFETDPAYAAIRAGVGTRIVTRLAPEVRKVFQFQVTHVERYIVACYESSRHGFFRAHRDNTTPGTAHRRFACTINLNAEEFSGGDLCFPEFGPQTYRAPTGGAIVFSCSLLHEAQPVTAGTRYAFLPFFYDSEGEAIRAANAKFIRSDGGQE